MDLTLGAALTPGGHPASTPDERVALGLDVTEAWMDLRVVGLWSGVFCGGRTLGVEPDDQGQGDGGGSMVPPISRGDAEGSDAEPYVSADVIVDPIDDAGQGADVLSIPMEGGLPDMADPLPACDGRYSVTGWTFRPAAFTVDGLNTMVATGIADGTHLVALDLVPGESLHLPASAPRCFSRKLMRVGDRWRPRPEMAHSGE